MRSALAYAHACHRASRHAPSGAQSYWGAIFKGDFAGAEAYLSPTVTLNWYGGGFEWVPVQGTFIGKSGWAKFFGAAGGNTRNFTILDLAYVVVPSAPSAAGGGWHSLRCRS